MNEKMSGQLVIAEHNGNVYYRYERDSDTVVYSDNVLERWIDDNLDNQQFNELVEFVCERVDGFQAEYDEHDQIDHGVYDDSHHYPEWDEIYWSCN